MQRIEGDLSSQLLMVQVEAKDELLDLLLAAKNQGEVVSIAICCCVPA